MEDKAKTTKNLLVLVKEMDRPGDVEDMTYEKVNDNHEYVTITFKGGHTRIVNVTHDSELALCKDVLEKIG